MDTVTGNIILSEMKVEVGVYEGDLPVMRFGVVQLSGNPPFGNPNSFHRFLLRGLDYNDATAFICDCGEAFLGLNEAYDHFFNKSKDPKLFQNERINGNDKHEELDLESSKEASSNNINLEEGTIYEGDNHSEIEMESGESRNDTGSVKINIKDKAVRSKLAKPKKEVFRNRFKNIESPRYTIEAIFTKFGYRLSYEYVAICSALLNVYIATYRNYAYISRRWKPEENPYRKFLNTEVMARAEKVHQMVNHHISTKTLPDKMKERTENEMIVSVLCHKKTYFTSRYKTILAKHLQLGQYKMNVLYNHVQNFKLFNYDPVPAEIRKKADKYHKIVTTELRNSKLPPVITKTTDAEFEVKDERLYMEAIWEKYGMEFGDDYQFKCADHLHISKLMMREWWLKACVHADTSKNSYYANLLTDEIRAKAEEIHKHVLNSVVDNPDQINEDIGLQ